MQLKKISQWRRIVIKIGTNSIMSAVDQVDFRKMDRLAFVCSTLIHEGYEVALVSSGAVGVGASLMEVHDYPQEMSERQALSAIGQSALMGHYGRFFDYYGTKVAQILLTKDVFDFDSSRDNFERTMNTLFSKSVIPIINENDVISEEELEHITKFGENDTLSAIVAENIQADLLIILSDVDGLYTKNPKLYDDAVRLSQVTEINDTVREMATGKGSEFSLGGMATKINAAERMINHGQSMIIASSDEPAIIFELLFGADRGTLFSQVVQREHKEEQ